MGGRCRRDREFMVPFLRGWAATIVAAEEDTREFEATTATFAKYTGNRGGTLFPGFEAIRFGKWNSYRVVPLSGEREKRAQREGRLEKSISLPRVTLVRVFSRQRAASCLFLDLKIRTNVFRRIFGNMSRNNESSLRNRERKRGKTPPRDGSRGKGLFRSRSPLWKENLQSAPSAEKRLANRNSWLSINRCHSLTSLPARSVDDILMTSRHTSVQNGPTASARVILSPRARLLRAYLDWEEFC